MRRTTQWAWGLLALAVLLAGCKMKQLEDEKNVPLDAKEVKGAFEIPSQPKNMDVKVTGTTEPPAQVALFLVLKEDADAVMADIDANKEPVKVLAKSSYAAAPSLQGTAPAGKDCTVIASSGGPKTQLKCKVVGGY